MSERKRILIIEDDEDMVEAMKLMLEPQGHELVVSDEPEDGLASAKADRPDLILLDVMFGSHQEAKGFEFAVRFKQEKELAAVPILMITSVNARDVAFNFSPETDEHYLPVDGFIDKPAKPDELAQQVETLLRQGVSAWANWPEKSAPK